VGNIFGRVVKNTLCAAYELSTASQFTSPSNIIANSKAEHSNLEEIFNFDILKIDKD